MIIIYLYSLNYKLDSFFKNYKIILNRFIVANNSKYIKICNVDKYVKFLVIYCFNENSNSDVMSSTIIPNIEGEYMYLTFNNIPVSQDLEKFLFKIEKTDFYLRQRTFGTFESSNNGVYKIIGIY